MKPTTRRRFLSTTGRYAVLGLGIGPVLSGLLTGCQTIEQAAAIGTQFGVAGGLINDSQAASIRKSAKAIAPTFEDFTPEQEYYIGRTVGAVILDRYPPYTRTRANRYLNLLGQTLAQASDMPETFGGYHFQIQDSDDINALTAPGGLIFVTRGLLRCCQHEDAVAAVLAHEIGHVQSKHGLQAIKKSRIATALATIGIESAKQLSGTDLAELSQTFEDAILDITTTLINSGYSRSFEIEADATAIGILTRVGYNSRGLEDMLAVMQKRLKVGGKDFAATHPSPDERIAEILELTGSLAEVERPRSRQARFESALEGV